MIKGKHSSGDVGWTNKMAESRTVTDALKVMRDRDVWKVMIALAKEQGT